MSQLPHPVDNDYTDGNNKPGYPVPKVTLIQEHQWLYLQRRYRITERELQIAKLICRGFNNEEISKKLNVKHGTVKTHIRNIYRKTWVHNKIAMLLRFVEDINNISP